MTHLREWFRRPTGTTPLSPTSLTSQTVAGRFHADAVLSLSGAIFARGVIFILQILIARQLGVAEFNLFVTASVVGATVYLASDLGLRPASLFISRGDPGACQSIVQRQRSLRCLSAFLGLLVGTPVVVILAGSEWSSVPTAAMLVGAYVIQSYSRYIRAPLRAASRIPTEVRIEAIEKATILVAGFVGLALKSLEVLAFGQVLGSLTGLVLTSGPSRRFQAKGIRLQGSALRYGLTLAAATGAPLLYSRLDYLVLVRIGTPHEAAVYAASYSVLLGASLLPMALSEAAIGHLGDRSGVSRYLRSTLAVGVAGAALIAFIGPVAVRNLYGFEEGRLGILFLILAAAFLVMTWNSSLGVLAPLRGRQRLLLGIVASAAIVCLVLCLALVNRFGIIGAGLSTLFTELYVGIMWLILAHSRTSRSAASEVTVPAVVVIS